MNINRRSFLMSAGAALTLPVAARADAVPRSLTTRVAQAQLAPEPYPTTEIWGFDGQAPGPILYAKQGARFERRLLNDLHLPTSIHWHGIRIDNAMDGVSGLTQDPVEPGEDFDYAFNLPDAGTYWYHAHSNSYEQVARGLHGALIVTEPEAPDVDREEVLVLDDWRLDSNTAQIDSRFDAWHDLSHAGRLGNLITTNGVSGLTLSTLQHERIRLRLINAANARVFVLSLMGLEGWAMALDGMPLDRPARVESEVVLAPGQRVDLIVDVIAGEGDVSHLAYLSDSGEWWSQVAFPVTGVASSTRRPPPEPLPANPRQSVAGVESTRKAKLVMEGGAMGRLQSASYDGRRLSFREMAEQGQFWALNGTVGRTDTPLIEANLGETIRVEIQNKTAFPHAMHLHGMHFREVHEEGALGPLRDTLLVQRGETREVAFIADNLGDWLFHCHMLAHAASGMSTWLRVN
ncbi:multicopper oxidase family protein [Shimia sp. FJ5]|uniref:multicopper oxidase family protein n=1 Tax=Shimia sp. FJ5 TaxID=3079054 RepID=UPI00397FB4EE